MRRGFSAAKKKRAARVVPFHPARIFFIIFGVAPSHPVLSSKSARPFFNHPLRPSFLRIPFAGVPRRRLLNSMSVRCIPMHRIPSLRPQKSLHIHISLCINYQSWKRHRSWLSAPPSFFLSNVISVINATVLSRPFVSAKLFSFMPSGTSRMLIFLLVQLNETQFPGDRGTRDGCHTFRSVPPSVVRDPTKLLRNSIAVICSF